MSERNLTELHRRRCERFGPRPAIRYRQHGMYHDVTWEQYRAEALACAAALADVGIAAGDRVGILSENRLEWLIADMGLLTAGAVNVPPHAPLTARQVHYQLHDADVRWLFVSTSEQLAKIEHVRGELPHLEGIVAFDKAAVRGEVQSWEGFLSRGRRALPRLRNELARREEQLQPDDLATIMYTSGTTGNPKGVMLTHNNLLSNALATDEAGPRPLGTVLLNWLPFSHIYARTVDHYLSIAAGVLLYLAESAETVVQNLGDVHPTHMSSVPRFYEKVLTAVADSDPAETGRRLRKLFGPRLNYLTSGGAPLPPAIAQTFKDAGVLVLQGYGLTETSPVISFNTTTHYKLDTVGRPIPGVEVAIGPDGEVLTRGPHVMRGYWKNEAATKDAIRDGWFHTGDLGRLDEDGYLAITGRKKELMVLSNGKKVVPTFLEGLLLADECFDQVVIHGEGRNFLTALIVPHWDNLRRALRGRADGLADQPVETLAGHPTVRQFLQQRMDKALTDVATYEQIRRFVVLPKPFSIANEELTVSLKLRRDVIFDHHADELRRLYEE